MPSKRIAGVSAVAGDDSVSVATTTTTVVVVVRRRLSWTACPPAGRRLPFFRLSRPRKTNYSASCRRKSFCDSFGLGNQLNKNTRRINGKRPASALIIKRLCYGTPTATKIGRQLTELQGKRILQDILRERSLFSNKFTSRNCAGFQ